MAVAYLFAAPFARDQLLAFARAWQERNEGVELAHGLVSAESLLDYLAAHPDQAALASWEIGAESEGIQYNARRAQPVAAGGSLLLLAATASELGDQGLGRQTVPLATWERYWLPGTDGGAHEAALHELRARTDDSTLTQTLMVSAGASGADTPLARVQLDDIVQAMVRYGDPAAADLLIDRLGRKVLLERIGQLGFSADAAPLPWVGTQLSFLENASAPELLARFRVMPRQRYQDATWDLLTQLRDDDNFRAQMLQRIDRQEATRSLREAADFHALLSPRGTASSYAHLMQRIASSPDGAGQYARSQLEWPLQGPATRDEFEAFGSMSGSQPGICAAVSYGRAKGATETRVVALLLRNLPLGVWLHLSSSFVLRRFQTELLADGNFFRRAKAQLHSVTGTARAAGPAADPQIGLSR